MTKVALRFDRKEAPMLRAWADAVEAEGGNPSIFNAAAESAERDDPLELHGFSKQDVEQVAQEFVQIGLDRPAIDELNG
jgi:hypothetical protein